MIRLDWSFDSGSLGMYDVDGRTVRVLVRRDYDRRGRNWTAIWCYFCVHGAQGEDLEIRFIDLTDEWNEMPSFSWGENTRPVFSEDGVNWRRFERCQYEVGTRSLTVRHTPASDALWIAYIEPYPLATLEALCDRLRSVVPAVDLGTSVQGRHIKAFTFGEGRSGFHAFVIARQHPWETGTSYAAEGLAEHLAFGAGRRLLGDMKLTVVPVANPDGVALGGTRYNALGCDPNRNYDQATKEDVPETYYLIQAVEAAMDRGERVVVFNLHNNNQETVDFIAAHNDALDEDSLKRFGAALSRHTFFGGDVRTQKQAHRSPSGRILPFILLELRTGYDPTLKRYVTAEDQKRYGAGLAEAIYEVFVEGEKTASGC